MSTTTMSDIREWLFDIGLCLVGVSSKSGSTYWAITEVDGAPRLRLSDHAVVHACSDSAVCVGPSLDDDYSYDRWEDAVRALYAAQVAQDRQTAEDQDESPDDAEASIVRWVRERKPRLAEIVGIR